MVEIIPAILPKTFNDLKNALAAVHDVAPVVQIDAVDGIFAPNKTWPYGAKGSFEKILKGDEGLPYWEDVDFQFDLMVAEPTKEVPCFVEAGASGIVIHAANPHASEALDALQSLRGGDFAVAVGVALLPSMGLPDVEPFVGLYDFVQVMGIEAVGFQGKLLDDRACMLIKKLRELYPECIIQVDGGVALENVYTLAQSGANRLVCGSAIFGAPDAGIAYQELVAGANA
jgi:ribulose-phosphate 3-epimerase